MLTLSQYGVTLRRLETEDIEEVRLWRNEHFIQNKMLFTEEITPEMQANWFNSIDNKSNYYFIIIDDRGRRVGLINSKNVSIEKKVGEGGIFISDLDVWHTATPVIASMILINFSILLLKSFDRSIVRILKSNKPAIEYNKKLGYLKCSEDDKTIIMELTKESYLKVIQPYSDILRKLHPKKKELVYTGTASKNNIDEINNLLKKI
ncbi:MAG: GNAT family N-acetyltransferase [Flavobacteriales bacterium]|nr:GNAT family N-acetyltransferase [Flavobacteriales bacterium]